jgi:moderate conductance mechanosensitive channel
MRSLEALMTTFDFAHVSPALVFILATAAFVLAALVVWWGRRFVDRSLATLEIVSAENRQMIQRRARQAVTALAVAAFGLAGIATLSLSLSRAGFDVPDWTPRQIVSWLLSRGVHVLIIIVGAYITLRAAHLAIDHLKYRAGGIGTAPRALERQRRAATLGSIVSSVLTALVFFLAGLMVLREMSIDIVPLLTGAGIAGLAIGFGAQNLVRDVISGFFMILEDQVGVGDVARIQSVTGVVEEIRLRTIVLRDAEGAVHVFPNGTVTTIANLSKDFSYAVADVVVLHGENLDRVIDALRTIGGSLLADPEFAPLVDGPFEVLGVQELREVSLTIRCRFKTVPFKQVLVAAELRRRIALGLAARGVRPFKAR